MSVIVSKGCTFLIVRNDAETSVFASDDRSECNVVGVLYQDGRRRLRVIYTSGMLPKGTEITPDDPRLMTPRHFESTYSLLMKGHATSDHAGTNDSQQGPTTTTPDEDRGRSEDSPVPMGSGRRSLF